MISAFVVSSARIARVQKARDGLDERLSARLELIDSYAKVVILASQFLFLCLLAFLRTQS